MRPTGQPRRERYALKHLVEELHTSTQATPRTSVASRVRRSAGCHIARIDRGGSQSRQKGVRRGRIPSRTVWTSARRVFTLVGADHVACAFRHSRPDAADPLTFAHLLVHLVAML